MSFGKDSNLAPDILEEFKFQFSEVSYHLCYVKKSLEDAIFHLKKFKQHSKEIKQLKRNFMYEPPEVDALENHLINEYDIYVKENEHEKEVMSFTEYSNNFYGELEKYWENLYEGITDECNSRLA